jgi:hypothetical protein
VSSIATNRRLALARGQYCPEERQRAPTPQEFRAADRVPVDPSGPTPGASSSWISDVQNYADPENHPLIPHTPSLGRLSLADLARQLPDADAQRRPAEARPRR